MNWSYQNAFSDVAYFPATLCCIACVVWYESFVDITEETITSILSMYMWLVWTPWAGCWFCLTVTTIYFYSITPSNDPTDKTSITRYISNIDSKDLLKIESDQSSLLYAQKGGRSKTSELAEEI